MTIRVFISEMGTAQFKCPECQDVRIVDLSRYKDVERALSVKISCSKCKHPFTAFVDRRLQYRKEVDLPGHYRVVISGKELPRRAMTVNDISRTGLRFKVASNGKLNVGDRIHLDFQLDDARKTEVEKEGVIRKIEGDSIGVQFLESNPYNQADKDIGFYMLP
jgi:hypothetical protein